MTRGADAKDAAPGLVLVGRFGAPHGVRGEVRIKSFTGEPLALARYAGLTDAQGTARFALTRARFVKDDMLVAAVAGIVSRDDAAALTGTDIYMPRTSLPPPDDDEFYVADLVGMSAVLADGSTFGTVMRVDNHGGGDILVVATEGGETLLPFTKAVAPHVDMARRLVTVAPPDEIDGEDDMSSQRG